MRKFSLPVEMKTPCGPHPLSHIPSREEYSAARENNFAKLGLGLDLIPGIKTIDCGKTQTTAQKDQELNDRTLLSPEEFIFRDQGLPCGEPEFPDQVQPLERRVRVKEPCTQGLGNLYWEPHPPASRTTRGKGEDGGEQELKNNSYLGSQGTEQGEQKAQGAPGPAARPWGPHRCAAHRGHSGRRRRC